MKGVRETVLAVLLFFALPFSQIQAADAEVYNLEVGVRGAFSMDDEEEEVNMYELFAALPLPWEKGFANGWNLETVLDMAVGLLDGGGETGGRFILGPELYLNSPEGVISLTAGLGMGVMTEEEYGAVDFDGPIFFRLQGGINYWLTKSLSLGYRYLHESNGSLYDKNPSLNMHQFELRVQF